MQLSSILELQNIKSNSSLKNSWLNSQLFTKMLILKEKLMETEIQTLDADGMQNNCLLVNGLNGTVSIEEHTKFSKSFQWSWFQLLLLGKIRQFKILFSTLLGKIPPFQLRLSTLPVPLILQSILIIKIIVYQLIFAGLIIIFTLPP